jgi:hypothetical protein
VNPAVQALLTLAEAEQALVADGAGEHADALVELGERREQIMGMLPASFDAGERAALQRALALQAASTERIRAARDEVAAELRRLDLGRRTARGYAPAGVALPGSLSLRG